MRYTLKDDGDPEIVTLRQSLETVIDGFKLSLVELSVSKHRGSVQVRAVIYNGSPVNGFSIGTDDCSKVHRAVTPRLELAFGGQDIYLEVSSPGTDRLIKDGAEFAYFSGRGVRCYRTDISGWTAGILKSSDEEGIVLETKNGDVRLGYGIIAKARLDDGAVIDGSK